MGKCHADGREYLNEGEVNFGFLVVLGAVLLYTDHALLLEISLIMDIHRYGWENLAQYVVEALPRLVILDFLNGRVIQIPVFQFHDSLHPPIQNGVDKNGGKTDRNPANQGNDHRHPFTVSVLELRDAITQTSAVGLPQD